MMFSRSIEVGANYIEKYGYEVEYSRDRKVAKMRRAVELLNNAGKDNFIEQAEKELGFEVETGKPINEPATENDKRIFARARLIEIKQWVELWAIIKGDDALASYENHNGSDIRGWWN